jgi:hypothetical protein
MTFRRYIFHSSMHFLAYITVGKVASTLLITTALRCYAGVEPQLNSHLQWERCQKSKSVLFRSIFHHRCDLSTDYSERKSAKKLYQFAAVQPLYSVNSNIGLLKPQVRQVPFYNGKQRGKWRISVVFHPSATRLSTDCRQHFLTQLHGINSNY